MNKYCHQISGFFSHRDQAEAAYSRLVDQGINKEQLTLRRTDFAADQSAANNESSNHVLKTIMINIVFGVVIGSIVGMLVELSLIASNINLFVASPFIGPVVLIGWGASIGGFIGAVVGAMKKNQLLTQMAEEAILHGQFALVVETHDRQQTSTAKTVMKTAVGGYKNSRDTEVTGHRYE